MFGYQWKELAGKQVIPLIIAPEYVEAIKQKIRSHSLAVYESDTIKADPTQINQILLNLCTNAAQAMADSGGTLTVRLENIKFNETSVSPHNLSPGSYVKLKVSDTGPGIAAEIMDRIFDPYFTTKEVGKGTGIGLAVVHGIVNKHGGVVTVESQIGKGTSFHVFLPCIENKAIELGISAFVMKPFGKNKISKVIREVLDTHSSLDTRGAGKNDAV